MQWFSHFDRWHFISFFTQFKIKTVIFDTETNITDYSTSNNSKSAKQYGTPKGSYELDEAQKKFGSAKGISSDQFFGNESPSYDGKANLSRFQGSNSISSSDYFGDSSGAKQGSFFLISLNIL